MRLSKRKLKRMIREEARKVINEENSYYHDIRKFLQKNASKDAGGYLYNGYHVSLDKMGDMTTFVNLKRDPTQDKTIASIKIEDGKLFFSRGTGRPSKIRPDRKYLNSQDTLDTLIKLGNAR